MMEPDLMIKMFGAVAEPSKSMEEHGERKRRCIDFDGLKDGEQKIIMFPAFDMRNHADNDKDRQYGQHTVEIIFAEQRGERAISVTFYTGISVDRHPILMDGRDIGLMCLGIYSHYTNQEAAGEGAYYNGDDCVFIKGKCYGDIGSSLYGEVILARLINEGSAGVWDEIDKEFKREITE